MNEFMNELITALWYSPKKQQRDKLHLLFHGAQSTVNSVRCHQARSKLGDQSREEDCVWDAGHMTSLFLFHTDSAASWIFNDIRLRSATLSLRQDTLLKWMNKQMNKFYRFDKPLDKLLTHYLRCCPSYVVIWAHSWNWCQFVFVCGVCSSMTQFLKQKGRVYLYNPASQRPELWVIHLFDVSACVYRSLSRCYSGNDSGGAST
jgi:hypothetical protein